MEIVFENPDFLIVNKPAGRHGHPIKADDQDTVLQEVAGQFPEVLAPVREGKPLEGGLIHRLDRGTSGLLVIARNRDAFVRLHILWTKGLVEKNYLAWVRGKMTERGLVEVWLKHDPKSKKRMAFAYDDHLKSHSGRVSGNSGANRAWLARSIVWPIFSPTVSNDEGSLVLVTIHKGVMHQIRATLAILGHPVLGDANYEKMRKQSVEIKPLNRAAVEDQERFTQSITDRLNKESMKAVLGNRTGEAGAEKNLPPGGFFLHAWRLKSKDLAELSTGIEGQIPHYFNRYRKDAERS